MIVDLKNTFLLGKPIKIKNYMILPQNVDIHRNNVSIKSVKADLNIYNKFSDVFLDILLSVTFLGVCDRCTKEISKTLFVNSTRQVKLSDETDFLDDEIILSNYKLNIDDLIISDVVAKFPDIVLCKDGCRGICPICYKNRNNEECSCTKKIIDPRLQVLKKLL